MSFMHLELPSRLIHGVDRERQPDRADLTFTIIRLVDFRINIATAYWP